MRLRPRHLRASRSFDLVSACFLARVSLLAYLDEPGDELARMTGLDNWRLYRGRLTDAEALLVSGPGYYILAFRGTEIFSLDDLAADASTSLRDTCGRTPGRVHNGALSQVDDIFGEMANVLGVFSDSRDWTIQRDGRPIFVTGHSLGGMAAQIAATILEHYHSLPIAGVYTFGQPRTGDAIFAGALSAPFFRVINNLDAFAALPLPGYEHGGQCAWIENGTLRMNADAWRRACTLMRSISDDRFNVLADHSIAAYCDELEALIDVDMLR